MCTAFMYAANAQPSVKSNAVLKDPNSAVITFDNLVHDYGTVQKGADGSCEFKFKNTGKEPLILADVKTSCGCTIPSWSKEPILPGKTGIIKVNYTKMGNPGTISRQITVTSNAKNSTVVLSIKGTVVENAVPDKLPNSSVSPQK